ncbi:hypothetical protein [Leptolyngbya sp. FACHB-261]|uniref:hypothetical protein n=1 Tax=Leptolyngbya sp. FACHB-261 TaxID=2692806 RepID=UPI001688BBD3|nr:hypothetical protein [Leptolyngbya sp. FACHB-261]
MILTPPSHPDFALPKTGWLIIWRHPGKGEITSPLPTTANFLNLIDVNGDEFHP